MVSLWLASMVDSMSDDIDAVLVEALEVLRHYRTRVHVPTDSDDWCSVVSMVNRDAMNAADRLLAYAKRNRLLTPVDPYF